MSGKNDLTTMKFKHGEVNRKVLNSKHFSFKSYLQKNKEISENGKFSRRVIANTKLETQRNSQRHTSYKQLKKDKKTTYVK